MGSAGPFIEEKRVEPSLFYQSVYDSPSPYVSSASGLYFTDVVICVQEMFEGRESIGCRFAHVAKFRWKSRGGSFRGLRDFTSTLTVTSAIHQLVFVSSL